MDTQHRGKRLAIHVLFAGLTCIIASATGFLLSAQSQTIEIWRGSEMREETFEPAKTWTRPGQTQSQPATIEIKKSVEPQAELPKNPTAREIMADAVKAADNGEFEEAIQIARQALQYEADWTVNELTPAEFIQHWEAELAYLQNPTPTDNSEPTVANQPQLVERPTFEAPIEITDQAEEPAPQAVPNEAVELKVPGFGWEPVQNSPTEPGTISAEPNSPGAITADSTQSQQQTTETRLASQTNYAPNDLVSNTTTPTTAPDEFLLTDGPQDNKPVGRHTDALPFKSESQQVTQNHGQSQTIPSGLHFNIGHTAAPAVGGAAGVEDKKSFYVILAVLSLIFVFGFSLVFLAVFILLKDRGQSQAQDNVLRLDLGSLQGLAQLAHLGGGPYGANPQQYVPAPAPAPVASAPQVADPSRTPAVSTVGQQAAQQVSEEDAMFQHLLDDNIEMYRNINQLPNAA